MYQRTGRGLNETGEKLSVNLAKKWKKNNLFSKIEERAAKLLTTFDLRYFNLTFLCLTQICHEPKKVFLQGSGSGSVCFWTSRIRIQYVTDPWFFDFFCPENATYRAEIVEGLI
jgi:hypothetical protein